MEATPTRPEAAVPLEDILFRAMVILLAGLLIYLPTLWGGWVVDDGFEVTDNITVKNLWGLGSIWSGGVNPDYLPVKATLQWALWQTFGNNPAPFRTVSLCFHLLSALLVWRLLFRLGLRHAWIGGLLFVVHPVLAESVAWPAELKNTLSLALLLGAMLAWLRFDVRRRWQDYAWALGLFVFALLSKSSVIMFPAVILLHAWWKRRRIDWRDLKASLPFWAVSLGLGIVTVLLQRERAIGDEVFPVGGVLSRIALAGTNITFYTWKILCPAGLSPMYPQWQVTPPEVLQFLPWPVLFVLLGWLWTQRHTWGRTALLGVGFYLLNLLPVLGFLNMSYMRISWVSDHLVYLPSLGLIGLAAAGAVKLYDFLLSRGKLYALALGGVCLAFLMGDAFLYARVFVSIDNVCQRSLAYFPDAWLAHQLLAVSRHGRQDYKGSLEHAEIACRLRPDLCETQNTIGVALSRVNRPVEAIEHLREAIKLAPKNMGQHLNLANAFVQAGRFEEAIPEFELLSAQAPKDLGFICNIGVCMFKAGHVDDAVAQFRRVLEMDPNFREAKVNLEFAEKTRSGLSTEGL